MHSVLSNTLPLGFSRGSLSIGDGRTLGVEFHNNGWGQVCTDPSIHVSPISLVSLGMLDKGPGWPLPMPATFLSFLAITWPLPTPDLTKAMFAEVDSHCWIALCTSLPAVLAVEVLIQGLNLGKADRVVSAPDEETVMVGTVPPITTRDEWAGGSTTKGDDSSSSSSSRDGRSARLGQREVERSISGESNKKG